MKSSYTKRALAFWLAVAMVATSAPMAFAADLATGAPTSPTTTETSDGGTPIPQAGLTAENQNLDNLTVGTAYTSASPIVSGGQGAYTMAAKEGTLPKWLTLTTEGKLTGTPTEVGTGTVTVIISDSTEGAALTKEIQITYNVKAKEVTFDCDITGQTQMTLKFDQASGSKTYGDEKFTLAAKVEGASACDEITYTSSNPAVAEVNSRTGEVTIKNAGTTTITANMQGTQTTTAASDSYQLTVNKANHDAVNVTDSVFASQAKSYTFDLPQEVRELAGVTYGQMEKSGDLISSASIANQKLSVTVTSQNADTTGTVTIPVNSTNYAQFNLVYTLKAVSKADVSNNITFADKTEYYTGKAIQLSTPSIRDISASGTAKWTYTWSKDGVQTTSSGSETMPSFTEVGTYHVTATYEDDANLGRKSATLTIKPAESSNITIYAATQLASRYDDNYSYFNVKLRDEKDGYARVRADANDYLVNQKKDGTSSEWIGMTIEPKIGSSRTTDGLWIAFSKNGTWYKLSDIKDERNGDIYITDVDGDSFDLWFDTDDRDCSESIYLATDKNGSNKFELYVDFNSYSGSSSSSSGSSSSNTSKKDGDRVSTTTVDKTPSVKNGSATVTFSSSALSDALDDNKKEAKREKADKTYIELDVKNSKSVDDTTITVPRSSLDKLADEDTGLKLTTNQGTVTFDDRALAEIYDACDKTNIEFYLEEEDDDQYVLLIKDGSSDVIDLGRGSVEVTFDYKLKSGEKSSDVKVYRIGNGDKTWLATYGGSTVYGAADVYAAAPTYVTDMKADYSSSKKKVTFTTDALGTFLITTDTLKTGSGSTTTTPTYNAFVDVPSSRWSAAYINKLASLGIINGTGGGYFEPTLYVTREEFVKMLAGVAGANVTGYTSSRFPDVPLSRWSAPYIAWAADRGITTGTDGGNFAPAMRITREEMATMIYRYVQSAGKTLPAKNTPVIFADANLISGWAQTPVSVMQQAGIIDGNVTNGRYTFDPKVSASREECAKMLAVLYDLVR